MTIMLDSDQFNTLKKVKDWHYDSAQKEVVLKRTSMEQAKELVDKARQARVEFAAFRVEEKRRLYREEAEQGQVKLGKISNVNYELAQLQQRLLGFVQQEDEAAQRFIRAEEELQAARQRLLQARGDQAKYQELGADLRKQQLKHEEQGQEREYEDFRCIKSAF